METKWLEDFVSLAETNSFSRSAELRHVTQPAFSRRIQSLEAWLGSDLIDRTSYPTRLTHAGEVFYEQALAMLGQINNARALLRGKRTSPQTTVDFAVPHTLSLTYVPRWLTGLESAFGEIHSRLLALNVHDAVMTLVEGGCDLLLCYHHPRQPLLLDASQYDMISMGREALRAYTRCNKQGQPDFVLPGTAEAPLPFLAYANNAYLGRMVDLVLNDGRIPLHLEKCYETDMAEGLKMMALEGRGVAFLPASAVTREVRQKLLARADEESGAWELEMEIRLYRERPSLQRPGKAVVSRLWEYLEQVQSRDDKKVQKKNRK
ncbi:MULTISPECIES: LysR family transcriptional regulator [unclassified Undibacterium]|uniref:LysR family transcriptional regulator n=1 Tax=unclassified Undibacterium TaxID=2630295 RepID=UPI002AC8BABC|nr:MULTISPECIES: LysR family transcriptional regulator [unclassified Undibacterium]MEB0138273.1 LysR family transcriptional regulator [Undibacterium sp. CCC2.1]MEB0171566.1 LysR family transcriptional regulator [Undibacterium sp. CCC1.1]MEB0175514.1 LysR family transcriptional regulator [Undibacterium sp. CCC3.4]MEB0214766.1 LysR family transcriptional regulator [Undibacterium sp. 5I2]WPX45253.1 LysR family transcriptional regulator [Undibacterium sp. CCC3.4]